MAVLPLGLPMSGVVKTDFTPSAVNGREDHKAPVGPRVQIGPLGLRDHGALGMGEGGWPRAASLDRIVHAGKHVAGPPREG
eukprot:7385390-Alexandrium_andersonii.AAC.1